MLLFTALLVTLQNSYLTNAAVKYKRYAYTNDDRIMFPGPTKESPFTKFGSNNNRENEILIPQECKGKSYCTIKPPNYPEEKFNKMYKGTSKLAIPPTLVDINLGNRQGDTDDWNDCTAEVTYEPLYTVMSGGKQRTVVQAPGENYLQRVRLETCKNSGESCFKKFPVLPGITTYCKQAYSTWELVVEKEGGGTEKIPVELPVCCSCHYRT